MRYYSQAPINKPCCCTLKDGDDNDDEKKPSSSNGQVQLRYNGPITIGRIVDSRFGLVDVLLSSKSNFKFECETLITDWCRRRVPYIGAQDVLGFQ